MKKLLTTIIKAIIFFIVWALLSGLLPLPAIDNAAIWRFWAELMPFLYIVVVTFIFWLADKKKTKIGIGAKPIKSSLIGLAVGVVWVGSATAIMLACGAMKFVDYKTISMLWLWIVSVLINTMMQELLVRGYLYQMIKSNYNVIAATIVTTALFTFMHGGAFEAGVIPVLNVVSMSLLMTIALERTQSILTPIVMHFIWNGVGAIIMGVVSLAEDYPQLLRANFNGNVLLTGGAVKMEGSVIVLIVNVALIVGFVMYGKGKGNKDGKDRKKQSL